MKWQHRTLRTQVWHRLKTEVGEVRVSKVAKDCTAWSAYRKRKILVVVDTLHMSLLDAAIHELLHWILDPLWEHKVCSQVYEEWIVATTAKIHEDINELGHEEKWRQAIMKKNKRG